VVAPQQGFVAEAHVRAGDIVKSGDLMLELDQRELQLEREKWQSERAKYARERQEALATRQRSQVSIAAAKIEQAEAQIRLIEGQLQRARLQAPFDGIVVSGDFSQALGAPVERGQLLFEVAPLHDYRVALEVDEHQIARIAGGQHGSLRLAGTPHQSLPIQVGRVIPVANAADGRNFFRVEAAIDDPDDLIRPGMQGIAKVTVGHGRLGWVLLHDLVERLRLWVWSHGW
jgi:RND family efflux transporter MFP subunit